MKFIEQFEEYKLPIFKNGVRLPEIIISKEEKEKVGLKEGASNLDYLKRLTWNLCLDKIKKGLIKQSKEDCAARLKFEFEVFVKTGTIDYILLLMDIFLWCDDQNIPRGVGRGSAAGSLTLMILGLTNVNPLDHDLNFTRFLNEARAKTHMVENVLHVDGKSFADFDGDVSMLDRPKIIRRIEKDYPGKTCKILTMQYLTGKMALKDTMKSYLEYTEQEALEISGLIDVKFGKVQSLEDAYLGEKKKDGTREKPNQKFVEWVESNKEAYECALKIESLFRTTGQHASGILLSYYDLEDIIPMQLASTGEVVSGYDMDTCLTISLKGDLLGLRTTDVLQIASEQANIKYTEINIYDPSIYRFYETSDAYYGLFQIEDGLTKEVVKKIRPKNIDQLAACLSISRPGAFAGIGAFERYVKTGEMEKLHPAFDKILEPTGGLILYQETINNICQNIYKMSATDADEVRRCIGKKDTDGIKKWEPIIYKLGEEQGIPKEVTAKFWSTVNASADYLFNANHCLSPDTVVETKDGDKMMFEVRCGEYIKAFNAKTKEDEYVKVLNVLESERELYEVELEDGRTIKASMDHKFLCEDMLMHKLKDIMIDKYKIITD